MWISTLHVVPQGNPLMGRMAYSKNPGLCLCSMWGPNWIWAWMPPNSQALSKDTGCEPFRMSSRAWNSKRKPIIDRDVLSTPVSISDGLRLAWGTRTAPQCLRRTDRLSTSERDGSDLHVKQIELDWVSGVYVLVRVEELASEQKGLVLVHPLLSERPAVVQPVHWQHTVQPQGLDYKKETILDINILFLFYNTQRCGSRERKWLKSNETN